MNMKLIALFSWCAIGVWGSSVKHTDVTQNGLDYMARYGYYSIPDASIGEIASEKKIRHAIKKMQRFAGIDVTGVLDTRTKELIKTPRCGLPDMSKAMSTRKRRFTLQGSYWKKGSLTWTLLNVNNDGLSRDQVEATLLQAFSKWQKVTNLEFRMIEHKSKEQADIKVKFTTGYHQDPYPFDGRGGTLAHAFYPHTNEGLSGDVHFDDDEVFTLDSANGRNLLWVAVHEIGHSIGLEHSNVQDSIMFPWYGGSKGGDFPLTYDDIVGIQNLYGSKVQPDLKTPAPDGVWKEGGRCPRTIGTVFLDEETQKTFLIDNKEVYALSRDLKTMTGPVKINKVFPGVEYADAMYTRKDNSVVVFSGTRYFVFDRPQNARLLDSGSIFTIYKGLDQKITNIDAAFVWSGNGLTYLFSGDEYYRFDENKGEMSHNYPRKISLNWHGVPDNIHSVFVWRNGVTYFFKDQQFYRLSTSAVKVEKNYPKSTRVWTKCPLNNVQSLKGADRSVGNKIHFSLITCVFAFVIKIAL